MAKVTITGRAVVITSAMKLENINAVGASFGSETRDDDKLACITLFLDGVTGDVKDWVADRLGAAIINLNKLEEKLPTVLEEIAAEKATVMSNITVAQ